MENFIDHTLFSARVISQQKDLYTILSEHGEFTGTVTGKFRYSTKQIKDYPVVGDFVIAEQIESNNNDVRIHSIVSRKNVFSRKMPISGGRKLKNGHIDGGITEEQIVASNIDTVFILCGLDKNFNIARIERYLTLVQHQKLQAIILLNKIDVCDNPEAYLSKVQEVVNDTPILLISASANIGLEQLKPYMMKDRTIAFLGSSGVGKSTLLNSLLQQEIQLTSSTSNHSGKGKHTTTHKEMFFHSSGCAIIDTPGMKELQLWAETDDLKVVYDDIVSITSQCKFSNCSHNNEPGCALKLALLNGELSHERYNRYLFQLKELTRLDEKKRVYASKNSKKK